MTKEIKQRGMIGRKPVEDKKQQITLYIRQSIINHYGGKDRLIEFINATINII